MLNKAKLKTELSLIYENSEKRNVFCGPKGGALWLRIGGLRVELHCSSGMFPFTATRTGQKKERMFVRERQKENEGEKGCPMCKSALFHSFPPSQYPNKSQPVAFVPDSPFSKSTPRFIRITIVPKSQVHNSPKAY
ncbi:hypothetical protein DPEC_G00097580 [Dallia pectoralis]|uniref:Uncharacterized protein n=1 Tax=Dallia pectoralis TaxID=75939 RepID=A0ACC2GWS1_DALPE|nr:hypothetical protein DPEC_G00097580 [Dallia pectoralis]